MRVRGRVSTGVKDTVVEVEHGRWELGDLGGGLDVDGDDDRDNTGDGDDDEDNDTRACAVVVRGVLVDTVIGMSLGSNSTWTEESLNFFTSGAGVADEEEAEQPELSSFRTGGNKGMRGCEDGEQLPALLGVADNAVATAGDEGLAGDSVTADSSPTEVMDTS